MSTLKNTAGDFMPHMEGRTTTGTLAAVNAEVVHNVNGDTSAIIYFTSAGTMTCVYNIQASIDGFNFFDVPSFPIPQACSAGTIPSASQPLVSEAINAASAARALCVATGGYRKIRIRLTAYTGGTMTAVINSDDCPSPNPYLRDQKSGSLTITATAAAGTAVTATLAAVPSLRHYIDRISVVRSATAALTASATPVLVTSTNIPGFPIFTFGSDAGGVGVDKEQVMDFGGSGMAATALGTATTVVCPAYTNVIWRINVVYRLGL